MRLKSRQIDRQLDSAIENLKRETKEERYRKIEQEKQDKSNLMLSDAVITTLG